MNAAANSAKTEKGQQHRDVASVLAKLGVRDRAQAVILAYESGLVQASGLA